MVSHSHNYELVYFLITNKHTKCYKRIVNSIFVACSILSDRKFLDVIDFGEDTCSETEDCKSALQYCRKPGFGFDAEPTQVRLQFPGRTSIYQNISM